LTIVLLLISIKNQALQTDQENGFHSSANIASRHSWWVLFIQLNGHCLFTIYPALWRFLIRDV